MRIGRYSFRPTLAPSLITLLLLPVLLSLGFWQLDRARQKTALQARFQAASELPYVPVATVDPTLPESRYRQVSAVGRYDNEHQILLDNQVINGQPGYQVFTPLRLEGQRQALLVARGWLPLGASREQTPDITVNVASIGIKGRLSQPSNPGLCLGEPATAPRWPRVVQCIDYNELSALLGYPLLPAVILLDPAAPDGYHRDWRVNFGEFGPERNRAYAVQWFALAAALLIIYVAVNTRRHSELD